MKQKTAAKFPLDIFLFRKFDTQTVPPEPKMINRNLLKKK